MADTEVIEVAEEEAVEDAGDFTENGDGGAEENGNAAEDAIPVKMYQTETTSEENPVENGTAAEEDEVECEAELVSESLELVDKDSSKAEPAENGAPAPAEDRTEDQVTEIEEDRGKINKESAQPSLDDVAEITDVPVEVIDETSVAEEPAKQSENEVPALEEEELVEIPVSIVTEEEERAAKEADENAIIIPVTSDEAAEEEEPAPAEPEPEAEAEQQEEQQDIPVEVMTEPEPEPPAPEPEPEPEPPKASVKKQASFKSSRTPSVETSEPLTPTSRKAVSFGKSGRTPSVEDKAVVAEKSAEPSVEEIKEEPAALIELQIESEEPPPPEAEESAAVEQPPADEEEAPVKVEVAAEPEAEVQREKAKVAEKEPSPPPVRRFSRTETGEPKLSRRQMREEGLVPPPPTPAPQPTPPPPVFSHVTYASYAPTKVHSAAYVPYSAGISPVRKFQNEYTAGYSYRPPTSSYMHSFDNIVKTGSFSQNLWAQDRARSRTRSLERRQISYARSKSNVGVGSYGPPPLRRRDVSAPTGVYSSRPSSVAPSRSTSFTNLMDYVDAKNYELRRSRSRDNYSLSRTPSRSVFVNSSDALNQSLAVPITRVDSYVKRLNEPYESTISAGSYASRYSDRPYSPYISAVHYEPHYQRESASTRRLKRWMVDAETPSTVRSLYETRIDELERNLYKEREARNRLEQERSYLNRELGHVNKYYTDTRKAHYALDTALTVNRSLRGRVENLERRYAGFPVYTPPYYGLTPALYPTGRYYLH